MQRLCNDCGLPCRIIKADETPLCPECKMARERRDRLRREAIQAIRDYWASQPRTLAEKAAAARKSGTSYGKYTAKGA